MDCGVVDIGQDFVEFWLFSGFTCFECVFVDFGGFGSLGVF